ncbi:MAG: bifunctional oligoribonuclease/PAP phosphatase NrnA [Oscillospiraceae bacterium]|nr:bifunctional oligoribonuclease/PAP phosphatase NrnA [Oscillospiraceae bacterium]
MRIDIAKTAEFLKKNDCYYIIAHAYPDGDTIGSCFALYYALKHLGKKSKVICSDTFDTKYNYLFENVNNEDFEVKTIIACDIADVNLLGDLLHQYGNRVNLAIDHHMSHKDYAENCLVDPTAAANCEIVFRLIKELNVNIDADIAQCLYTGIVTDTGCFRFSNTTSKTHSIVAELLEVDFPYYNINREMFEIKKMERIRLETILISEMESYFNNRCHMVVLRKSLMEELALSESDLEGITSITTQIGSSLVGITVKEKEDGKYKISMRSTGTVNVSEICQRFGGGGHYNASGCTLKGTEQEVKSKIITALSEYLNWGSVNAE